MTEQAKTIDDILRESDKNFGEKFTKLKKEISEDLDFGKMDQSGIETEIIRTVSCMHRWAARLAEERKEFEQIEYHCRKKYADLYDHFRNKGDLLLKGKTEIDQWIVRNPAYAWVFTLQQEQSIILKYIEDSINSFRSKSFALRNIIDNRKYFDS